MLNRSLIGKKYPPHTVTASAEQIARFASAIGDTSPDFSSGQQVPVTFGAVYAFKALRGVIGDPELHADVPGRIHGGQEFRFQRYPRSGETLTVRANVEDISERGHLEFLVVRVDVSDADGDQVMEIRSTLILRKPE